MTVVFYVRHQKERRMVLFLLVLINISQLFFLGSAVNVQLSYTKVQANVKKNFLGLYVPNQHQQA